AARRLLRRAPVVTVPSEGLVRWMGERTGVDLERVAHVVPHLGLPPPPDLPAIDDEIAWPDRPFVVCHVGALLSGRDPVVLLRGWRLLVEAEPDAARDVGIAVVGSVDRRHQHDDWPVLLDGTPWREAVTIAGHRVPQDVAQAASRRGTVGLVLESRDPTSPFLPAKVADLLVGGKPILALTPAGSPTAELLGDEHPLRVDPGDAAGVARALRTAWQAWRDGDLDALAPPAGAGDRVSVLAVGEALDAAL
ncbi:hypothetical protein B7486_67895, partial [cyanobacterium TDX16]